MTDALLRNYKLQEEVLGRGKFGVIRRCSNKWSGQHSACKTIRKSDLLHDSIDRDFLYSEIKIMQYLSGHPAVVALHEAYEDDEVVHLVMEMCSGGDLFDRIASKKNTVPFSEEEAATVLQKLMEAISYCHSMGIAHRDIKPDNILFVDNSNSLTQIKLTDFGQASSFSPGQGLMQGIVGTPYYVAPEVLEGKDYGEKVDVWSAGVILYIMLSGVAPFMGETPQEIFEAVLCGRLRFPTDPWLSISRSAKDLIRRMLSRDVTKRLSAQQVLEVEECPQSLVGNDCRTWLDLLSYGRRSVRLTKLCVIDIVIKYSKLIPPPINQFMLCVIDIFIKYSKPIPSLINQSILCVNDIVLEYSKNPEYRYLDKPQTYNHFGQWCGSSIYQ